MTEGPGAGVYSGSADGCVRVWDVAAKACTSNVTVGGDVGALLVAGGWLFIGTPGRISCWPMTGSPPLERHDLGGFPGAVQSLCAALERSLILSAGQDRTIRAWAFHPDSGRFQAAGVLAGHEGIVTCLLVAGNLLFSGSGDGTVRVWDLDSAACVFVCPAHAGGVMAMVLWEGHLITTGLDGKVRVWTGVGGPLTNVFTHPDQAQPGDGATSPGGATSGVFLPPGKHTQQQQQQQQHGSAAPASTARALAMCGTLNAALEPLLVVSYDDGGLRFFALPSFEDRGRLPQRVTVRALAASGGGFLSGDEKGLIRAWSWKPPHA